MGGAPGLTQVPVVPLPAGSAAVPMMNPPGFMSAREASSHVDAAGSGGYTMVDGVPYRWKMVAGKLELEKVPLTAPTSGVGYGSLPRPTGGVSLPQAAVVPRAMPPAGNISGTERPGSWKTCDAAYAGRIHSKQSHGARRLDHND